MIKTNSWKEQLLIRLMQFAVDILDFSSNTTHDFSVLILLRQLIRSATSIGANVTEAQDASSLKDFINKLSIALREAKETRYWLELIKKYLRNRSGNTEKLLNECNEIIAILTTSIKSAKLKI